MTLRDGAAIILAALAFSLWGYGWYATIFDDVWQVLIGRSEQELIDMTVARGQIQNVMVIVISLVQALGVWLLLKFSGAKTLFHYIGLGALVATLIVLPALGNATLFAGTPLALLILDYGHFLLGYMGIALTLFLLRTPVRNPPRE